MVCLAACIRDALRDRSRAPIEDDRSIATAIPTPSVTGSSMVSMSAGCASPTMTAVTPSPRRRMGVSSRDRPVHARSETPLASVPRATSMAPLPFGVTSQSQTGTATSRVSQPGWANAKLTRAPPVCQPARRGAPSGVRRWARPGVAAVRTSRPPQSTSRVRAPHSRASVPSAGPSAPSW